MPASLRILNHGPLLVALVVLAALLTLALPAVELLLVGAILVLLALGAVSHLSFLTVLLVLAPLRALIATEADIALPLDIGQILLVVYWALWLASRIANHQPVFVLRRDAVLNALLLLCCLLSIGAWNSASLSEWIREWLKWVIMTALVWQLSLSAEKNWRWLIFALLAAACANAFVGIYIFFGGSGAEHLVILGRYFRAFGTFGQPNPFGGFMGIILPLAIMGAYAQLGILLRGIKAARRLKRTNLSAVILLAGLCALLGFALLASWSRGAWLGSAFAVGAMLFAIPKRVSRGLGYATALALVLGGLWISGALPQSIANRLTAAAGDFLTIDDIRGVDISPENYAVMERIAHWQAALNMAEDKPFFGVGLGNYEVVYDGYRLLNWRDPLGHAHNFYLNMLAEVGFIGLLAYLTFWLLIFAVTWRARAHPDPFARAMAIGLLGSWTYLAVHSVFDNLYVNNLFLHIGVLLAMLSILHRQTRSVLVLE